MRKLLLVLGLLSFAVVAAIRATGVAGAAEQLLAIWSYLAIVRGLGLDRWLAEIVRLAIAEMRADAAPAGRADA